LQLGQRLCTGKAGVDGAKYVANDRAQDHEDRDNNDGNQNKNQSVFDQALASFLRRKQHGLFSPFLGIFPKTIREVRANYKELVEKGKRNASQM
jgi:hypothetical protein